MREEAGFRKAAIEYRSHLWLAGSVILLRRLQQLLARVARSAPSVLQLILAKAVALAVLSYATVTAVRLFRSNAHLAAGIDREDALRTFMTFVEGTDSPRVLLAATHAAFGQTETGPCRCHHRGFLPGQMSDPVLRTETTNDRLDQSALLGDNLSVLREHIPDQDLIYLDPPFNFNATYNASRSAGEESGDHRLRRHRHASRSAPTRKSSPWRILFDPGSAGLDNLDPVVGVAGSRPRDQNWMYGSRECGLPQRSGAGRRSRNGRTGRGSNPGHPGIPSSPLCQGFEAEEDHVLRLHCAVAGDLAQPHVENSEIIPFFGFPRGMSFKGSGSTTREPPASADVFRSMLRVTIWRRRDVDDQPGLLTRTGCSI